MPERVPTGEAEFEIVEMQPVQRPPPIPVPRNGLHDIPSLRNAQQLREEAARLQIASAVVHGLMANMGPNANPTTVATLAVRCTDALLTELKRTQPQR